MSMQQHPLWNAVRELLFDHDCVIIPGFGGFVCNTQPAKLDQVSHVLVPPAKHVVFNQNLRNNDGLLANFWAQQKQVRYTEAVAYIESTVTELVRLLTEHKQLEIDHFGKFRLNAEANYVFIPSLTNTYLHRSFGLSPIQATPVGSRQIKVKQTRMFKERKPVAGARKKSKTGMWPAVLATTLVVLLSVNMWIYLQNNSIYDLRIGTSEMSIGSWFDSLFHKPSDSVYTQQPVVTLKETLTETTSVPEMPAAPAAPDSSLSLSEPMPASDETAEPVTENQELLFGQIHAAQVAGNVATVRSQWVFPPAEPVQTEPETPAVATETEVTAPASSEAIPVTPTAELTPVTHGTYYVIGGVFCKEPNAQTYMRSMQQKGYTTAIILNTRLNCKRVSLGSFNKKSEAESFLKRIQQDENPSAWIYSE